MWKKLNREPRVKQERILSVSSTFRIIILFQHLKISCCMGSFRDTEISRWSNKRSLLCLLGRIIYLFILLLLAVSSCCKGFIYDTSSVSGMHIMKAVCYMATSFPGIHFFCDNVIVSRESTWSESYVKNTAFISQHFL